MAIATKEEQLERLGRATMQLRLAIHHLSLAKEQPEKRDYRIFVQGAINALESALSHKVEET